MILCQLLFNTKTYYHYITIVALQVASANSEMANKKAFVDRGKKQQLCYDHKRLDF